MKRSCILFLIVILFSCNENKQEEEKPVEEVLTIDSSDNNKTLLFKPGSNLYIWRSTWDDKKEKNTAITPDIINTDSLIKGLNVHYENIILEKVKQSSDTLYTVIKDNEYLSQQMGSTGALIYLTDVILNLTEVPGIKYVTIDMEEGDHAGPGTWSAADFKNIKEIKQ